MNWLESCKNTLEFLIERKKEYFGMMNNQSLDDESQKRGCGASRECHAPFQIPFKN